MSSRIIGILNIAWMIINIAITFAGYFSADVAAVLIAINAVIAATTERIQGGASQTSR